MPTLGMTRGVRRPSMASVACEARVARRAIRGVRPWRGVRGVRGIRGVRVLSTSSTPQHVYVRRVHAQAPPVRHALAPPCTISQWCQAG
jgi:hypothetical protein